MPYKLFVEGSPAGRSVECDTIEELVAALKVVDAVGVAVVSGQPTKKTETKKKQSAGQARSWAEAKEFYEANPGLFSSVDEARKELAKRKKLKEAEELLNKSKPEAQPQTTPKKTRKK